MVDKLYEINILWKDIEEETIIICPELMVVAIVSNLTIALIERIKITQFIDAI